MWFAFVVLLTMQAGQPVVVITGSDTAYATEAECVTANQKVENSSAKVAKPPEGLVAYHFECKFLDVKDFKKPGLDV